MASPAQKPEPLPYATPTPPRDAASPMAVAIAAALHGVLVLVPGVGVAVIGGDRAWEDLAAGAVGRSTMVAVPVLLYLAASVHFAVGSFRSAWQIYRSRGRDDPTDPHPGPPPPST